MQLNSRFKNTSMLGGFLYLTLFTLVMAFALAPEPANAQTLGEAYIQAKDTISPSKLKESPGYQQTYNVFEAVFGDVVKCASTVDRECGGFEGNFLVKVLSLLKFVSLLSVPILIGYLIIVFLLNKVDFVNQQVSWVHGFRGIIGLTLIAPVPGTPLNVVSMLVFSIIFYSWTLANSVYVQALDHFKETGGPGEIITTDSLTFANSYAKALICADTVAEFAEKSKDDPWYKFWGDSDDVAAKERILGKYVMRAPDGEKYTLKIKGRLEDGDKTFFDPLAAAQQGYFLERIDLGGMTGSCSTHEFNYPHNIRYGFDIPYGGFGGGVQSFDEMDPNDKLYYQTIIAGQKTLIKHIGFLAKDVGFFGPGATSDSYALPRPNMNQPDYDEFVEDLFTVGYEKKSVKEMKEMTARYGTNMILSAWKMQEDLKNQMTSQYKMQSAMVDLIEEAKQKGLFFAPTYLPAIFASGEGQTSSHRDFFSGLNVNTPPQACSEKYEPSKCITASPASAERAIQAVFEFSIKQMKQWAESGVDKHPDINDEMIDVLTMTQREIPSVLGGGKAPQDQVDDAVVNIARKIMSGMLTVSDVGEDAFTIGGTAVKTAGENEINTNNLYINPITYQHRIAESLAYGASSLTVMAYMTAFTAGTLSGLPLGLGSGALAVWEFADGFLATYIGALAVQSMLLKVGSTLIIFSALFFMTIGFIISAVGALIIGSFLPLMLLLPGSSDMMFGARVERILFFLVEILTKPVIDVISAIAALSIMGVALGLLTNTYWHAITLIYGDTWNPLIILAAIFGWVIMLWATGSTIVNQIAGLSKMSLGTVLGGLNSQMDIPNPTGHIENAASTLGRDASMNVSAGVAHGSASGAFAKDVGKGFTDNFRKRGNSFELTGENVSDTPALPHKKDE